MKSLILAFRICSFLLVSMIAHGQQSKNHHQDYISAFPICDLKTYHFDDMAGYGDIKEEIHQSQCFGNEFRETNSMWLKFQTEAVGALTFVISPNQDGDDIDFMLYKQEGDKLLEIRCMASGEDLGKHAEISQQCLGVTGLAYSAEDEFETRGCTSADDNFLKVLATGKNSEYYLWINNFTSGDGFSVTFEGECTLKKYSEWG